MEETLWLNDPIYNPMQEILEYKSFTLIQIASSPYEGSLVAHCWLAEPSPCNRATMANRWQLIHPAFNPVTRASHQPLAFLLLVLVEFSNFDIDVHQYSVMVSSPCIVERRGCLNTETGALVGQKRYLMVGV